MTSGRLMGRLTLIQQWVAATILGVIPLLVALSYAAYAFQEETARQRQMVKTLDQYSRISNAAAETVKEMVRLARQYRLLSDASFLELYRQKNELLGEHVRSLEPLFSDTEKSALLTQLGNQADTVLTSLKGQPTEEYLSEQLRELVQHNEDLAREVNRHQQLALRSGEEAFNRIIEQLFLISVLALPGTLLLMILGTYTVSRSIWRLSEAIRSLGSHNWDTSIDIRGPSDLVALGENLDWMRRQVVQSDQQKTAFIQHVTHELKTPLAAIIEAGNLLDEEVSGPLSKGQQDILQILIGNAHNLSGLIEQLLNYNAVSHGMRTSIQPVSLKAMCDNIRRGLDTAFPDKRIQWVFFGNPAEIHTDPRLMEMILKNLMGNAVQFSPPGGEIRVTWGEGKSGWHLDISDQGPGIEEDEIDKIFEPFYKGRSGREDRIPKNGIGLAIVRECVKLLNGEIVTESKLSRGTTFRIHLPVKKGIVPQ